MQVQGYPVGVHVLQRMDDSSNSAWVTPSLHDAERPDATINTLLRRLREAKSAGRAGQAVAAALDALAHDIDQVNTLRHMAISALKLALRPVACFRALHASEQNMLT